MLRLIRWQWEQTILQNRHHVLCHNNNNGVRHTIQLQLVPLSTSNLKHRLEMSPQVLPQTSVSTLLSHRFLWRECSEKYYCSTSTPPPRLIPVKVKTHYEVLNISSTATTQEIREAFLQLSKECHPDLNFGDPGENHQRFVSVNEAYTVLNKPSSRRDYDLTLQVNKHIRQQSYYPAYRSHGYQTDAPHYHYRQRSHVDWDGMSDSSQSDESFQSGKRLHRILVSFSSLTVVFTIGFISLMVGIRDYVLPVLPRKAVVRTEKDFSKHNFIMTSLHDGQTVMYYAVPDENNPESFKVHAFLKREVDGDPDNYVLEELNSVS